MLGIYLLVFDNLVVTFQIYFIFAVSLSPQWLLGNMLFRLFICCALQRLITAAIYNGTYNEILYADI